MERTEKEHNEKSVLEKLISQRHLKKKVKCVGKLIHLKSTSQHKFILCMYWEANSSKTNFSTTL